MAKPARTGGEALRRLARLRAPWVHQHDRLPGLGRDRAAKRDAVQLSDQAPTPRRADRGWLAGTARYRNPDRRLRDNAEDDRPRDAKRHVDRAVDRRRGTRAGRLHVLRSRPLACRRPPAKGARLFIYWRIVCIFCIFRVFKILLDFCTVWPAPIIRWRVSLSNAPAVYLSTSSLTAALTTTSRPACRPQFGRTAYRHGSAPRQSLCQST